MVLLLVGGAFALGVVGFLVYGVLVVIFRQFGIHLPFISVKPPMRDHTGPATAGGCPHGRGLGIGV